jgi:hemolysin III
MTHSTLPPPAHPEHLYQRKERANTITHGIGLLLSLAGAVALVTRALHCGDSWHVAAAAIYSLSLIAVYAMSTLSHAVSTPDRKRVFRVLDQACIYLLIVGTYTPFSLVFLRSAGWSSFLGALWFVALAGFFSKILWRHRVDAVSVWLYVILGWAPVFAWRPLVHMVPAIALYGMLIGGLCYTIGTIFLCLDKQYAHFHVLWHLWVMAGSLCHYVVIFLFVVAPKW